MAKAPLSSRELRKQQGMGGKDQVLLVPKKILARGLLPLEGSGMWEATGVRGLHVLCPVALPRSGHEIGSFLGSLLLVQVLARDGTWG
jgi:hypothetical protein